MRKLRLWCEHSTADGSVAYVCMCVDAEVGGQLCMGHGVSGLRQARTLSADGGWRMSGDKRALSLQRWEANSA